MAPFLFLAALAAQAPEADADLLRRWITEGGQHCEAGRPDLVIAHTSRDLVLSFPGAPDTNYEALAQGYRRLCASGEGTVESTVPTFEEVLVDGNMALVRVIWTTRLRGMPPGATRQLRDMQVWRRGREGWQFVRGVHYPYSPPAPAPAAAQQGERG